MMFSEIGIRAYGEVDRLADMTVENLFAMAEEIEKYNPMAE